MRDEKGKVIFSLKISCAVGSLIPLSDSDTPEEASSQDLEVAELGYGGSDLSDYLRDRVDSVSSSPSDSTSASSNPGSPSSDGSYMDGSIGSSAY
ncbi:hypothetical protein FCM35_KLT19854 [Carex littledalei]|uniref:Uncharacterized protein n=1 Tax=Carex littledalei TaxID=544730 RepID=A0A833RC85_9POAL|nr:hypothetical protein FCM35_KLT19854 [Carex littledalei]